MGDLHQLQKALPDPSIASDVQVLKTKMKCVLHRSKSKLSRRRLLKPFSMNYGQKLVHGSMVHIHLHLHLSKKKSIWTYAQTTMWVKPTLIPSHLFPNENAFILKKNTMTIVKKIPRYVMTWLQLKRDLKF